MYCTGLLKVCHDCRAPIAEHRLQSTHLPCAMILEHPLPRALPHTRCRSLSAKAPPITGLFCGKYSIKTRRPSVRALHTRGIILNSRLAAQYSLDEYILLYAIYIVLGYCMYHVPSTILRSASAEYSVDTYIVLQHTLYCNIYCTAIYIVFGY